MKKLRTAIVTLGLVATFSFAALGSDGGMTLEELQRQAQETVAETSGEYADRSAIGAISGAAKMDMESETIAKAGQAMNSLGGKVIQFLGYVISIGLGIVTAIDCVYIAIPPLRGMLANGYIGTAGQENNTNGGMGSMGSNQIMLGYQGAKQQNMNVQMNNQPASGRTQWVTNAALNAVTQASTGANPFKVYLKEQLIVCIMAPLVFVLADTGVLSLLGFILGEAVSGWIGSIST